MVARRGAIVGWGVRLHLVSDGVVARVGIPCVAMTLMFCWLHPRVGGRVIEALPVSKSIIACLGPTLSTLLLKKRKKADQLARSPLPQAHTVA